MYASTGINVAVPELIIVQHGMLTPGTSRLTARDVNTWNQ